MRILFISLIILFVSCSNQEKYLGKAPSYSGKEYTVSELVKANLLNTNIRLTGTVKEVCNTEGCWFILSDGKSRMRCIFESPSIAMDKKFKSTLITVEGMLTDQIVDKETAQMYAEQIGDRSDSISGKKRVSVFVVSTIMLQL